MELGEYGVLNDRGRLQTTCDCGERLEIRQDRFALRACCVGNCGWLTEDRILAILTRIKEERDGGGITDSGSGESVDGRGDLRGQESGGAFLQEQRDSFDDPGGDGVTRQTDQDFGGEVDDANDQADRVLSQRLQTERDDVPRSPIGNAGISRSRVSDATANGHSHQQRPERHANGYQQRELEHSRLTYALAYARHGMRVFPCHNIEADRECSCGTLQCKSAGKHPRLNDWQTLATTQELPIRKWWAQWPDANVGVRCGESSGLTVLDVDGDEGRETLRELELEHGELPDTPIAITGSGGAHYYFKFEPELQNAVRFAKGLDVRTEGGLVVGVGSVTKQPYQWEAAFTLGSEGLLPAPMPSWLAQMIAGSATSANGNGRLHLPAAIPSGERNNWLYRLGRSLKARGMGEQAIMAALHAENAARCSPPMETSEVMAIAQHAFAEPDRPQFTKLLEGPAAEDKPAPIEVLDLTATYNLIDEWDRQPWVWDGVLPHSSLSLIVGKSETGKSTMIYALIYSIVRGVEFFGRNCQAGHVVYLAGDPASEIVAGKTFRTLGLLEGITIIRGALAGHPEGMKTLRETIARVKPVLVVADTLAATVPIDVDKYGQSYQAQQPLSELARTFKPNFLMSHHSQKSAIDSYSVIDAALGSVGVAAVASTRMGTKMYKRKGERFYTFEMSNCRIGKPIEGEWTVKKFENGMVGLDGLWRAKQAKIDKAVMLRALNSANKPLTKRALWGEMRPKPKWEPFNDVLDELVGEQKIHRFENTGRGGGWLYEKGVMFDISEANV